MGIKDENETALLRLAVSPGFDVPLLKSILDHCETPEDAVEMPRSELARLIGREQVNRLFCDEAEENYEAAASWLENTQGASAVLVTDPDYPRELLLAGHAPAVLFVRGNRDLLGESKICVTGSCFPDKEGERNGADFADALIKNGISPVMGLSDGIERQTALALRGKNMIAVAATGPDRLYPAVSRDAFEAVVRSGLLVSAVAPGRGISDERLAARRMLTVAMSSAVLVVQSEKTAEIYDVMRNAAELGRDVMVIPGSIHSPLYKGSHSLIRSGAKLVESVQDITEGWANLDLKRTDS